MSHETLARDLGLEKAQELLLGGELRRASGGATLPTIDPTTERELARVPEADSEDVDAAVQAARRAFDESDWRRDFTLRKRTLLGLSRLAERDRDRFALLDVVEVGLVRTIAERFGARALVRNLEYYATWADKLYGEVVPVPSGRVFDFTRREPYGVVAAIFAWNTPSLFLGSKVGPALATGNTIVLKPSELGSLSALHFARLCVEAGVPAGVINVITGGPAVGERLVRHPGVDKLSFTGGAETARRIQGLAAETLKPLHLELGGKSPHVILADADLDRALGAALTGAFVLSGQACAAGSRLILEQSIHDAFLDKLLEAAQGLRIGDPVDPKTFQGPLVSERQLERVVGYVASGEREGAHRVCGGERLPREGYFLEPAIFDDVTPSMTIAREEIFGPVLSVIRCGDLEEAIQIANATEYGLSAGLWTRDVRKALRFAEEVRAGTVWVNQYGTIPHTAPFGGFRRSGYGREGGREALLEYTQVKNVSLDLG